MPPCRPCLRQTLHGTPQESQQLVKYPHPSSHTHPKLILNTPTYVGSFSQRFIHQHLPNLFHQARQQGDRVLDPLLNFIPNFQHYSDPLYYSLALDWVVTRVAFFAKNEYAFGSSFNVFSPYAIGRGGYAAGSGANAGSNPPNILQDYFCTVKECYNIGDMVGAYQALNDSVGILSAIGNVLRSEKGTSYSDQLMYEYQSTLAPFLPWTGDMDPRGSYLLLKAAYRASSEDPGTVVLLCNNLGPRDAEDARQEALRDMVMFGDRISGDIAQLIP